MRFQRNVRLDESELSVWRSRSKLEARARALGRRDHGSVRRQSATQVARLRGATQSSLTKGRGYTERRPKRQAAQSGGRLHGECRLEAPCQRRMRAALQGGSMLAYGPPNNER